MLGLKLPTDPRWVDVAQKNIEEILTDHAYCEQKAASTAISLIITYPEHDELVNEISQVTQSLSVLIGIAEPTPDNQLPTLYNSIALK